MVILKNLVRILRKVFFMYPLPYKGLRFSATFQAKPLCVGDFASFTQIFVGFYFG